MTTITPPHGFVLASVTVADGTRARALFTPLPSLCEIARAIDPAAFADDSARDMTQRRGLAEGAAMRVLTLINGEKQ